VPGMYQGRAQDLRDPMGVKVLGSTAYMRLYRLTEAGREADRRYRATEKYRAVKKRYQSKADVKLLRSLTDGQAKHKLRRRLYNQENRLCG
jgi:hypothetical protein